MSCLLDKHKVDKWVALLVKETFSIVYSVMACARALLDQLHEDLFLIVQLFEEEIRKTTLYLAFVPGERMVRARAAHGAAKISEEIPKVCTDLLANSKRKVATEGVPVETLLKEGHIVNEILETIIQGGFDLVIMGARGQSMIKKLLLGSVSNGVIRHASCSVLVAKK